VLVPQSSRDEWIESLRVHILTALSLPLVMSTFQSGLDIGGGCEELQRVTIRLDGPATPDRGHWWSALSRSAECPTDINDLDTLMDANGLCQVLDAALLDGDDRSCTYEYRCLMCCGYGRPYLDERGVAVQAGTTRTERWVDGTLRPSCGTMSIVERMAVGRHWLANARAEHSSVAGFHRFVLDLLAHGAPPELVARAQRAAAQELRHAIDSFTLASAYLGEPVGPAPMELGKRVPIARSLAELAAWTVRDGAIGETLAAYLAARALADSSDPAVRAALSTVVQDETDHALIAWDTLRWALEVGDATVRTAIATAFHAIGQSASATTEWTVAQRDHGVMAPEEESARAVACIHGVVLPIARALLA
jgi:hypothetical protein